MDRISLTRDEYEAVRSHPARFFVIPGHEDLNGSEVVVETFDRYVLVEKQGREREIVEQSDPRGTE